MCWLSPRSDAHGRGHTVTVIVGKNRLWLHSFTVSFSWSFQVMCAVNEQVRNFGKTGIKGDGRSAAELVFEESLEVRTKQNRTTASQKKIVHDERSSTEFDRVVI